MRAQLPSPATAGEGAGGEGATPVHAIVDPPPAPHGSPLPDPTLTPPENRPAPTARQRDAFNRPEIGRSAIALCSGTTLEGKPCRFAARHETGLCINHDPAYQEQQRQNTLRGARTSMARRDEIAAHVAEVDRQLREPDSISLDNRAGIRAILETVLRLELAGSLSAARSRNVTRMLSIASQNFERIPKRSGAVYTSSHYDPESFEHRRQALARLFPAPALPTPAELGAKPMTTRSTTPQTVGSTHRPMGLIPGNLAAPQRPWEQRGGVALVPQVGAGNEKGKLEPPALILFPSRGPIMNVTAFFDGGRPPERGAVANTGMIDNDQFPSPDPTDAPPGMPPASEAESEPAPVVEETAANPSLPGEASGDLSPTSSSEDVQWAAPRNDIPTRTAIGIGVSLITLALVLVAYAGLSLRHTGPASTASQGTILQRFSQAGVSPDVAATAAKVDAAVVNITSRVGSGFRAGESMGTGVVITSSGEVLTNNHVIAGATSISVTDLGNGRTYSATVVGTDVAHDIAVLQLQGASGLKTITVGDSSKVAVGDNVTALGNAQGTGGPSSISTGQVTALNQSITATDETGTNPEQLTGLIQISAPLQPGDSGGPLVNSKGQIVGIDTAASVSFRFRRAQTTSNEAYAVPINEAIAIAQQIVSGK